MTTRQLNRKNRTYYFYNDLINVLNFEASNLKLDKKTCKDIDIYYIDYVDKKPDWNVNSVNSLYLIISRVYGFISEKIGNGFLTTCSLELNIISKKLTTKKLILIVAMMRLTF